MIRCTKLTLAAGVAAIFLTGCDDSASKTAPVAPTPALPVPIGVIATDNAQNDRPKLKISQTVHITDKATLTITCKWGYYMPSPYLKDERECSGVLTQEDGKDIVFDPNAIAKQLIEPSLVPHVIEWSPVLVERDRVYTSGKSLDFWDETGAHWVRAN